jgi:hypothetical protein
MTKNQLQHLLESISDKQNPFVEHFLYELHNWSSLNYNKFTSKRFYDRMKWKAERYLQNSDFNKSTCYFEVADLIKQQENQSKSIKSISK